MVFLVVVRNQPSLSWGLIASLLYRLQLDNTPSIWWNRAETGPAPFVRSEARLRLCVKMKTKYHKQKHMQKREFVHFFIVLQNGKTGQVRPIWTALPMTHWTCASQETSGYEMNAVNQTEHLGWKACVYTTELRWWWRERKPGHYSKLKLKTLCKPSEIYHFSVSAECRHKEASFNRQSSVSGCFLTLSH